MLRVTTPSTSADARGCGALRLVVARIAGEQHPRVAVTNGHLRHDRLDGTRSSGGERLLHGGLVGEQLQVLDRRKDKCQLVLDMSGERGGGSQPAGINALAAIG